MPVLTARVANGGGVWELVDRVRGRASEHVRIAFGARIRRDICPPVTCAARTDDDWHGGAGPCSMRGRREHACPRSRLVEWPLSTIGRRCGMCTPTGVTGRLRTGCSAVCSTTEEARPGREEGTKHRTAAGAGARACMHAERIGTISSCPCPSDMADLGTPTATR